MKTATIRASWYGITQVISAEPMIRLREEVDKRGIRHDDLKAVEEVWRSIRPSKRNRKLPAGARR